MKFKKGIAIILSLIMLLGACIESFAAPVNYGAELTNQPTKSYSQTFKDVPKSYWAFSYISEMVSRGVLSGYPDGYFYPENNITRAEFAKIMTCAAGLTIDEKAGTNYDDVIWDDWSVPYIEAAKYYLSGYTTPDGSIYYFPDDLALREDIAVALVKLKGYSTTGYDLSILQAMFTDWQSISEGARKYVSVAIDQGLISGYDDRTFRGQQGITRAEAATLLWRAYQYGNGNKSFELVPEVIEKPDTKKEEIKREEFEKEEIKKKTDNIFKDANDNYEEEYNNYSYELSTLVPNVSTVNALVIVKGSLIYQTGNKLYKVDIDTGEREEFFDAEDIGIIVDGDIDKETRYNLESAMLAIGYNSADDHLYAFIEQDTEVYRIDWSQSIYIYMILKKMKRLEVFVYIITRNLLIQII